MRKITIACVLLLLLLLPALAVYSQADLQVEETGSAALQPGRELLLPGPFDSLKALKSLFPGRYYDLSAGSGYTNALISWQCRTCKAQTYPDVNGMENDPEFPFAEGVATRLLGVLDFSDATGGQYKLMAFNHSVYDADGMQTGRFTGGLLGLAKFARTDSGWLMRSFQPAIAAYGAFASCPRPQAIRIGADQYALLIRHNNGPGGGPFRVSYFLIAGANGRYRQVMAAYGTDRTNTEANESSWESSLSVPADDKKYFRDIVITITGTYFANPDDDFPPALKGKVNGIRSCHFRFKQRFVYSPQHGYQDQGARDVVLTGIKR